ncbi:MAG: TIGR01212 family radical SAM protein [Thermodesulfovibrionales bacterium]|nr:TIGR01212 family radical SAM protein [Thermodesulfovibrionales bacterium]
MQRYNSFGAFVKREFRAKVYKVNIDAGFTCPNRDGTLGVSGCIYCNNDSFRPSSCKPALSVREQVSNGIKYLRKRYGAEKFLAYFQPFSNTYAPPDVLKRLYTEALEDPSVIGLAIGTRPDCVDAEKLDLISRFSKTHFVLMEYGLQSVYEKTLSFIERGHDMAAFVRAVEMTKERGIHAGGHVIVGFPTETRQEMLDMAGEVSLTGIEFLKIHQLQVIKDTPLAGIYGREPFHVFGYDEYLNFVTDFIEGLSPDIVLQRLFATAPEDILIAPKWGRSRHEILRGIEKRFMERDASQGKAYAGGRARPKSSVAL